MKPANSLRVNILLIFFLFIFYNISAQYFTYVDPNNRTLDKTTAKPGTLPGSVDINSLGNATYEIPIFVSPGTAGMQPAISIVYNNVYDDGVLGKGWAIGGLSEIRRVSQNFYHDNQVTGVNLQNTDRFALDSNRLILTSQHQYGADGSEYATEFETFVKVIAHGSSGTGPGWFEVKTKDGKTLEYGNTEYSKVKAYGSNTVYMWRVNKVTDANGNYIEFIYNNPTTGESYVTEIKYTGNTSVSLQPYNSIKFNYYTNSRNDINIFYVAGSQIPKTKLLQSIRMETEGSALVREYQFKYSIDANNYCTHLNQVTEYGSDGSYFNSTIIGWGTSAAPFSNPDVFNDGKKDKFYLGDFNGDGRTDFVVTEKKTSYTTSDKWKLYLANLDGTSFTYINQGSLDAAFKGFIVADVDGNGRDDIFWRTRETIYYPCNPHPCEGGIESISQSTEFVSLVLPPPPPQDTCWDYCSYQQEVFRYYYYYQPTGIVRGSSVNDLVFQNAPADISLIPAELDGNGKVDYLVLYSNKNIYDIRGIVYSGYPNFNTPNDVRIIDFDGNGKKDILVIKGNNSYIYQYSSTTLQFSTLYSSTSYPTSNHRLFFGDYNGDRKTDFLAWNSNMWTLMLSNGVGFTSTTAPALINVDPNLSLTDNNYYIGDFNGDRKDDILEVYKVTPTSRLNIFFSKGGGNWTSETNTFNKAAIDQDFISLGDFNGDGQRDVFYYDYNLTTNYVRTCFFHKDELWHIVKTISNGFNLKTRLNYQRINTEGTFYTVGTGAAFPVKESNGAFYAVASIWDYDEYGDSCIFNYRYEGAKTHSQGKGFLGFSKAVVRHELESTVTEKTFELNSLYYFLQLKTYLLKGNNEVLSNQFTNTNQVIHFGSKRIFPYISRIDTWDNLKKIITVTWNSFDNYGNLTYSRTSFRNEDSSEDARKSVKNIIGSYGNYGIPNKVIKTTDSSTYTGQPTYKREIEYQYDQKGNLTVVKQDPQMAKEVTGTNYYNSIGLIDSTKVSSATLSSRTVKYEYDSKFRFVTKQTNPVGHYMSREYYTGTGNVYKETDLNGKITEFNYDGFGRLKKTITPIGKQITRDILWDDDMQDGSYYIQVINPGNPTTWNYYKGGGQLVLESAQGVYGFLNKHTTYDLGGRVLAVDGPHYTFDWQHAPHTAYTYDQFSRVTQASIHTNQITVFYNGRTTSVCDTAGKWRETTINALGDVVSVKENQNNNLVTTYSYHSSGQVKQVNSAGTIITTTYDLYGRPEAVSNPNSGSSTYAYNAYGELTSFIDARSNTFQYFYDKLGRVDSIRRPTPDGSIKYTYNSTGGGIEQVQKVQTSGVTYNYTYDDFGRMTSFNENINGEQSLTSSFTYDANGNTASMTYPGGFIANYVYTNGYLKEIRKSDNSLVWRLDSINGFSQPKRYSLGAGSLSTVFSYDTLGFLTKKITGGFEQYFSFNIPTGNLTSRRVKDPQYDMTESFTYDNLDRLITTKVGVTRKSITYSDNGNILSRTGTGTYSYDPDKKNAVKEISSPGQDFILNNQNITYTSFNKVFTIADTVLNDPYTMSLAYGPDQQRVKRVQTKNGAVQKTKYYGLQYEKEIAGTNTIEINYINSPYGLVAINRMVNSVDTTFYVETDHLGSILTILDAGGNIKEKYSYDAWGRRRNPNDWTYNNISTPVRLERGFTGHEHYEVFKLIDMNGRIYDPVIGRFLSPDPIIQSPDFTQSYNSFSYCFNNPLKLIDIHGYSASASNNDPWTDASWFFKSLAEQQAEQWGPLFFELFNNERQNGSSSGTKLIEVLLEDGTIVYVPENIAKDPSKIREYLKTRPFILTKTGYKENKFFNKSSPSFEIGKKVEGFIDDTDTQGLLGILGGIGLVGIAAGYDVPIIVAGARAAASLGSIVILIDAYQDFQGIYDPKPSDYAKLVFNFTNTTLGVLFSGWAVPSVFLGISDLNGWFDNIYNIFNRK